jgi:glyoxylase-like metal-dependent hydrolase (beta-lactamase superfamily II)
MGNETLAFNVGDFNCLALCDADWVNVLLIDTGQQRVLVDAGCGFTMAPPGQLIERLQAAGLSPADIDVVVLSHADADHIGGAVAASGNPAFTNARYVLSREEWAFWESKPVRLRRELNTFLDEAFFQWCLDTQVVRWAQLRDRLELIDSGHEIVPSIRAIAVPGHTPGMIAISVASGSEQLLFIGDVIYGVDLSEDPGNALITTSGTAWHAFVDMDPAQAVVTRERLLDQAARQRTLLMVPHLPFHGMGYVSSDGQVWRWQPHHMDD